MHSTGTGTIIDMTPDGGFAQPAKAWNLRAHGMTALAVAASLVLVTLALAVWVAVAVLPVLIALGVIVYVMARLRSWRRRVFAQSYPLARSR